MRRSIHDAHARGVRACLALAAAIGCTEPTDPPVEPVEGSSPSVAAIAELSGVVAGDGHSCGLAAGGGAYCWGANDAGQLGLGAILTGDCPQGFCRSPQRVVGQLRFRQLSAGSGHTCGVTTDDRLFCWGGNRFGFLGDGTNSDRPRPTRIAPALAFRQVSAGVLHTCAVTVEHAAYCWGHNQAGPLGTGSVEWSDVPARVAGGLRFREVSAGGQFTCGVTTADVAYCWGLNLDGELGLGLDDGPEWCFTGDGDNPCATAPARVARGLAVRSVSTAEDHACAVTRDDLAFCWGANYGGQLGVGSTEDQVCGEESCGNRPRRVLGGLRFAGVTVFASSSCGVTTDHLAYCWGTNSRGELGTGSRDGPELCSFVGIPCASRPAQVAGERRYAQVEVGGGHACGTTLAGRTFCWGRNESGQLGDGTTRPRAWPKPVVTGDR